MSKVILIKNDAIGENGELGRKLMLSFLATLVTMDRQPKAMYLLNRAVLLATTDSEGVEVLKHLEEKGVAIYSCQTCLGHFNVLDALKVGSVGNMQNTLNTLLGEDSIITL